MANLYVIFSVDAIVFGLLAYFLWIYYRGYGRQYVKFWTFSTLSLSFFYLASALNVPELTQLSNPYAQLPFILMKQLSSFWFVILLGLGFFSTVRKYYIELTVLLKLLAISTAIVLGATLSFAFDPDAVFNQFYTQVSLPQLLLGCAFIALALFLLNQPKQHFSARIIEYASLLFGLRYLTFSIASVLVTTDDWFQQLSRHLPLIDSGFHTIIGFGLFAWIYGAERETANTAISKARYLGQHDALTGLLNREQVLEKLDIEMAKTAAKNSRLAIFIIDIKRFKFINDTYGLKTGDYILGEIAHRLTQSILLPNAIGRLSGDSFLYALEYSTPSQIQQATEHLHELINHSYQHNGQEIHISCSIGYCLYPDDGQVAEDLLQKANIALFHAENQQISTLAFTDNMQDHGRQLLAMEKELTKALREDQFELYFQPQLNLLTNKLEGVEALIRWQHPERGLLAPAEFLPQVDALGLNSKLDNYVLEKACQTIAKWYQQYHRRVTVAINITAVEFQDKKLISTIQQLLFKYQIPPNCIDLEITENIVMTDLSSAMKTIVTLQNMGVKVSIDDFGTGYSSLSYLRALPIDKIKIDRSFVNEVARNDSDLTIVKSMIELSHALGKRVLAEGVETVEQLNLLKSLGCDAVQGYFISRPVPEQTLAKYLQRK